MEEVKMYENIFFLATQIFVSWKAEMSVGYDVSKKNILQQYLLTRAVTLINYDNNWAYKLL